MWPFSKRHPPAPTHVAGTNKGEELRAKKGWEPGRAQDRKPYRTARDSTSLNPDMMEPIDPNSPRIPPA